MRPMKSNQIEDLLKDGLVLSIITQKKGAGPVLRRAPGVDSKTPDVLVKGQNPYWVEPITPKGAEGLRKAFSGLSVSIG